MFPMTETHRLDKELATFERHKERLLAESAGKYALIRDDQLEGVWDTYEDALKTGYSRFGLEPFLVKRIVGLDSILFVSRGITGCP